jgi:hypothetical protein
MGWAIAAATLAPARPVLHDFLAKSAKPPIITADRQLEIPDPLNP